MKGIRLNNSEAIRLGFALKPKTRHGNPRYYLTEEEVSKLDEMRGVKVEVKSKSKSNDYKPKKDFVLSAWSSEGKMMEIDEYCKGKIEWFVSPWDKRSVELMSQFDMPLVKVPSALNTNMEYLEAIKKMDKPVVISLSLIHI